MKRRGDSRYEAARRDRGARARAHLARARERERRRRVRQERERDRARRLGGSPDPWPRVRRAGLVTLSVVAGMGLAALLGEPVLSWLGPKLAAVDTIAVQGQVRLSSVQIADATEVGRGTALANVDTATVEARLREEPWIEAADVLRLPPSTLLVRIREREPRALLIGPEGPGPGRLVDAAGTPFAAQPIPSDLPVLVGGEALGSEESHPVLVQALEVIDGLSAAGADALATKDGRLTLHLPEGDAPEGWIVRGASEIWLGRSALSERLARLAELIESNRLEPRGGLRIDLRFADQAVLRELEPRRS